MPRDDLALDDSAASLARKVSRESIATLIAVSRDPHAPASARAQCATKLLEIGHGRPALAKPMTVADLAGMSPELRRDLFLALWCHYEVEMPDRFQALLKSAVAEALAQQAALQAALPKPKPKPRFIRQSPAPADPPPATEPGAEPIRSDASAISASAGGVHAEAPRGAVAPSNADFRYARPAHNGNRADRDNVVVLPGVAGPYGLKYGPP